MSDSIIQVRGLGKSYNISHEGGKESYTALRDVITNQSKKIFSFPKSLRNEGGLKKLTIEEFWALKDVSFDIKQGDRVGIIGRNGAGKSTLLKILSRITEPTTGEIRIKGRVASLLEVGTGFHPELTGRENIFLNGAILGMNRAEIKRKFDEIVDFAEVEKFLDTPVKRYSSGMYVRLAFAVAAHLEPEILIIDEVLAVGDAQFQKKCLGKMEDVSKNEGRTVLFVSHNMGVVSKLCNKGVLLQKGQILFAGKPNQVIEYYLSTQSSSSEYTYQSSPIKLKENYIKHLSIKNEKDESVSAFLFNESIVLHFCCKLGTYSPNLQIGVAMQDKFNNRIFTVIKEIEYFKLDIKGFISGKLRLPNSLLAPNFYSFVFVLWNKDGNVVDSVENVCPIHIYDNGTELAQYESEDYGNIIINANWLNA